MTYMWEVSCCQDHTELFSCYICLFSSKIGLFWYNIGLFSCDIGFFSSKTGLFWYDIGLCSYHLKKSHATLYIYLVFVTRWIDLFLSAFFFVPSEEDPCYVPLVFAIRRVDFCSPLPPTIQKEWFLWAHLLISSRFL